MDFLFIITALGIGIGVSVPLGPIGILCIQRTMNKGFLSGFISGIGAAFADTLYAIIAAFGISMIKDFLIENQTIIRTVGSLFLVFVGYKIFNSNPAKDLRKLRNEGQNYIKDFITSFLITISNPITIVAFGAIFAGFDLVGENVNFFHALALIIMVFIGAVTWWLVLISSVSIFRKRIRLRFLLWTNKITGTIIVIFALYILLTSFFPAIDPTVAV